MKSKLFLSFLATATLGAFTQNAMAESKAKVFKTFDGAAVHCSRSIKSTPLAGSKNIMVELVGEKPSVLNHEASLKVTLVKCNGSQWTLDQNPSLETYIMENGIKVEVRYSDFEVLLVSKDFKVLSQQSLTSLGAAGVEQISSLLNKNQENPQDIEVIVRAIKSVKTSNGFASKEMENFGSFRLRIDK